MLLGREVYARDADLARDFERAVERLVSMAANLDCIGTDDPTAPPLGAPARDVLSYFLRDAETRAHLNRLVTRVDQLAGRRRVLAITNAGHGRR